MKVKEYAYIYVDGVDIGIEIDATRNLSSDEGTDMVDVVETVEAIVEALEEMGEGPPKINDVVLAGADSDDEFEGWEENAVDPREEREDDD